MKLTSRSSWRADKMGMARRNSSQNISSHHFLAPVAATTGSALGFSWLRAGGGGGGRRRFGGALARWSSGSVRTDGAVGWCGIEMRGI